MTPVDQQTDEPTPLLNLDELVDRRDFVQVGGEKYFLRTDGLGAIQHHRLIHCSERHDRLFEKDTLTVKEQKEMESLVGEMLSIVLDAPKEVRSKIGGDHARALVRHFQRASQPEAELMQQLLAQMVAETQNNNTETTEPEEQPSITES